METFGCIGGPRAGQRLSCSCSPVESAEVPVEGGVYRLGRRYGGGWLWNFVALSVDASDNMA